MNLPVNKLDEGRINSVYNWRKDKSFWSLLFSNLFAIALILINHDGFFTILLIYWVQSLIIGFFNLIRISNLKNFSTENLKINNVQPEPNNETRSKIKSFFILFYGGVLFLYFILMAQYWSEINFKTVLITSGVFLVNHLFSFINNYKQLTNGGNIGNIAFEPFVRLLVMHLTIFVMSLGNILVAPFLLLKTYLDLMSHVFKHGMPLTKEYFQKIISVFLVVFLLIVIIVGLNKFNVFRVGSYDDDNVFVEVEEDIGVNGERDYGLGDQEYKDLFGATEIVSNNLPESIEFWTEANCPNEGLNYEYELPQRFKLIDCKKGEKGSHGGCKTCEMSKIILWPREDIYIPLEKLKSDGEIIKFFDENNVISNYCNEGKCVDVISRNGGFLPEEIKRNISDYSLDKSYVAITGGCKSKGCRTTTFLIDESTGFIMPPQYSEFGCINSFVDSVELNMNRPPFFRIECSYYFDNFLTSENSLIYLSNGKIKVLPKISTYLMDGNSNDREWKVVDTYNRFVDLDGDNNKEIIEIGKSYIDTEKGKIEKEVIVNIYKWEDSKKIFELLPKTDKLYLDEDIYGPYLGFCMTQVGFESMRSWGVKVPEGYDGVGSVIADESFCREIDPGYSSFSNDCVSYDACKKDGVVSNSSAKKAGLASGDVVLEINGERFRKMDLVGLLEKYKVGDVVKIKVVKEGEIREVEVELERRPVDF